MSKDDESWETILGHTIDRPKKALPDRRDDPWDFEEKHSPKPKFQTTLGFEGEKSRDKKSPGQKVPEEKMDDPEFREFKPANIEHTLKKFMHPWHNDRVNTMKFGMNCYKWIIYYVTEGRFRMTDKGDLRVYTGEPGIHNIVHNKSSWVKLGQQWKESNLFAITNECNAVHEAIKAFLRRIDNPNCFERSAILNTCKMPEFVQSNRDRNKYHRTCRWEFLGKPLPESQGGGTAKPARPVRNSHLSIETILKQYNRFLPKVPTMI